MVKQGTAQHLDCSFDDGRATPKIKRVVANWTSRVNIAEHSPLLARLLSPLGVHQRRRVIIGQEAHEVRGLLEGLHAFLDLRK